MSYTATTEVSNLFPPGVDRIVITPEGVRPTIGDQPMHLPTSIRPDRKAQFIKALPLTAQEGPKSPAIVLNIEGVRSSGPPGVVFRVYLNDLNVTASTNPNDSNFVGSIAIYPSSNQPMNQNENPYVASFSYDISKLVQRLIDRDQWNPDKIDVMVVSKGIDGDNLPRADVTIDEVSISIES